MLLGSAGAGLAFAGAESIPEAALIQPADLAALKAKPMIICVAPNVLYRGAHIEGAVYGGFTSKPEGIAALAAVMKDVKKDREICLYCGCCPWQNCPNMAPAFNELKRLGFTNVKALKIATNLHTDWVAKGYPTVKAAPL
jgi:thiosulfate/3-mercaptopyruvate sulfurtransferase